MSAATKLATRTARTLIRSRQQPVKPSYGFSGAGFLTSYQLGAVDCLMKYGLLPSPYDGTQQRGRSLPQLTGVSGGALVATSIAVGMTPEDGLKATMEIARRTREASGILDVLTPG